MTATRQEIRRTGLGVSPGIAFGRAYLIGRDTLKAPRHHIEADDIDTEVARLYKAIAASDKQLAKIKEKLALGERERLPHHHGAPDDAPRRAPGRRGRRVHPRREDQRRVGAAPRRRRHPRRVRLRSRTRTCASGAATSSSCSSACCATCSAATPGRCRRRPTRSSSRTICRRPTPRRCTRPRSPGLHHRRRRQDVAHRDHRARARDPRGRRPREHHRARRDRRPAADRRRDAASVIVNPTRGDRRRSIRDEQRRQVAAGRAPRERCATCRRARSTTSTSRCSRTSTAPTSSTTRSSTARWASACSAPSTCS